MSQFRFARISLILAALGLNAAPALLASAHAQAKPAAAEAAKADTIRPDMFKLLDPAKVKEMMTAKKFPEVQANIAAAEAFPNITPYEGYVINRMKLALAASSGNDAMAMAALEPVINSGRLDAQEKANFIEALANYNYNAKNYPKAIEWLKVYQKESTTPDKVRPALARAYLVTNDYANAKAELEKVIAAADKAGTKPAQDDLRLLAGAAGKLKDTALYTTTLERLVTLYPTPEFWTDVLRRMTNKTTFNDRLRLDGYRLQMTTAKEMESDEYLDMAERAMMTGFFGEAKQALDAGFAAGKLGTGKDGPKHKQQLDKAAKAAADDAKTIDAGEAGALKAKTGTPLVNLGYAYVTLGQFDKGIDLIKQGIAKGSLKNPEDAKLRLGVAYAKAGKKDEALKAFEAVKGSDGTAELARYWTMHLNAPMAVAAK
ncbi:tetratricopeptide repeat protein [Massilia sp. TSP1-1-2]|uniref:tetratricopeptide repeat protein n=1 Tax=unclassified Massilia TaxID=2609279 RepID=UPI003CF633EB